MLAYAEYVNVRANMNLFRHRGCTSELIRYIGDKPLQSGTVMRSREWQWADGQTPTMLSYKSKKCPDCGFIVKITTEFLEEIGPKWETKK